MNMQVNRYFVGFRYSSVFMLFLLYCLDEEFKFLSFCNALFVKLYFLHLYILKDYGFINGIL